MRSSMRLLERNLIERKQYITTSGFDVSKFAGGIGLALPERASR